jgi:peptidoglycan/LPS O-acetylase OafA/YrhL
LAVEEQFYILWPSLLVLVGSRRSLKTAVAFVLIAPFIRLFYGTGSILMPTLANNALFVFLQGSLNRSFETVGDAIAMGCILAMTSTYLWQQPLYRRFLQSRYFFLTFLLVLASAILGGRFIKQVTGIESIAFVYYFLGISLMNIGIVLIIDKYIRYPQTSFGSFLNHKAVAYVGLISYSLYLWQQPFFNRGSDLTIATIPYNLLAVISLALLSYYLVEQPFLRLRQKVVSPR